MAAGLLAVDLLIHWNLVIAVYEALDAGPVGGAALTIAQLGYLPNLVVFALAWTSGSGFALGVGSQAGPLATAVGPLPSIPVFAALPSGALDYGFVALVVPALAGAPGRLVVPARRRKPLRRMALHQGQGPLVHRRRLHPGPGRHDRRRRRAARGGAGLAGARLRRHRRLTDIGPDPLRTALFVAAETGIGVVIGYAAGPWLERRQKLREADLEAVDSRRAGAAVGAVPRALASWAGILHPGGRCRLLGQRMADALLVVADLAEEQSTRPGSPAPSPPRPPARRSSRTGPAAAALYFTRPDQQHHAEHHPAAAVRMAVSHR